MLKRLAVIFVAACSTFAMFWLFAEHGGELFAVLAFWTLVAWILGFGFPVILPLARTCSRLSNSFLQFGAPVLATLLFLVSAALLGVKLAHIANHTFWRLP
jgi:hypothetical protein